MSNHVRGIDPATGDLLEISLSTVITRIERRPAPAGEDRSFVAPGFLDLQVNGFAGIDVNGPDVTADRIVEISEALALIGVTTWVPTIVTASEDAICHSLRAIGQARSLSPELAHAIPFAHVEGPFLSDQEGPRGVHDATQIRPIDADEVLRWQEAGPVGILTLSPHTDEAPAQIARIAAFGIQVAIGHTHASGAQIIAAVDAGATLSTHLGNGIFPQLARHPNPLWTQLGEDRLTCGFIADGHHLPAETLEVMLRAKGIDRAFLVSDATELAGKQPGLYETAVGGTVELTDTGRLSYVGTELLAGAASDVAAGLRFVLRSTRLSLAEALALVTRTPGRILGRETTLRVGAPADLVTLQADGAVVSVWRHGQQIDSA